MVISIIDNLLNTVVQRGELRNVGCPAPCEVKCNYICNEVAPVCPTECVGGYQRRSNLKRRNQQRDWWTPGISGKASRDRDCSYKKGAARRRKENYRQSQSKDFPQSLVRERERGREQTGSTRKRVVRPRGNRA